MAENKKLEAAVDLLADYGGFDRDYLKDKLLINSSKEKPDNKNKMAAVAKLFGKKLNERFTVKRDHMMFDCRFTKHGLDTFGVYENPYMSLDEFVLEELLTGEAVIVDA